MANTRLQDQQLVAALDDSLATAIVRYCTDTLGLSLDDTARLLEDAHRLADALLIVRGSGVPPWRIAPRTLGNEPITPADDRESPPAA
jgi:hypothetical protein